MIRFLESTFLGLALLPAQARAEPGSPDSEEKT